MRHVLGSALLGLVAIAATAGDVSAQAKLGYVNTQAVLATSPGRTTAETEFNRRMAPLNAEVQKMDSTLKAMFAAFTRDTTSPMPQREAKAQEIQAQQQQFQQRVAAIEDTAAALRQRLMQPLMQQLEAALEAVRNEGGYAMLFDVGQGASIVAADTTLDVTQRVIDKLKAMPAPTPTTSATPSTVAPRPAGVGSRPPSPRR
jgi:outer membrane protein